MSAISEDIQMHWAAISPLLSIRTDSEYEQAVERLNALIDEIGTDEEHPLYELLDTLGTLIHAYEEKHCPIPDCRGIEVLHFLLEEHELTTADLPEIGPEELVSEILDGQRPLTVGQVQALAERFRVSPAVFI
jgi:HTH-type transcriptional regulator/antitoxin HigA